MAKNHIYDLLDEVNCAGSCEAVAALCELVDNLVKDIQHLELIIPERLYRTGGSATP